MKLNALLTRDELRLFTRASDLMGWWAIAFDWALIAGSLALVAAWPNPLSVLVALVIIGGRQLGLAVLMHEASHRSLFATRWLNDVAGKWLCAAPVWSDVERYRPYHLEHHSFAGTERDPDLGLIEPFPVSPASFRRKVIRDLAGLSAIRRVYGQLAIDLGYVEYTTSGRVMPIETPMTPWARVRLGAHHLGPMLLTNTVLFAILAAVGTPWLYLLWVVAWLTTHSLFFRLRAIAEHACTERVEDPLRNTRTTVAGPLTRLTVAPHNVAYHIEHHLLMTAPYFRLPALHRRLAALGALENSAVERSYAGVLRQVLHG